MDDSQEAGELRRNMAQLRNALVTDAVHCAAGWRAATDWRRKIGAHPWSSLAIAAAAGYVVVPRRRPARDRGVSVDAVRAPHVSASAGLTATVGTVVIQFLVRSAIAAASRYLGQMRESHASKEKTERLPKPR